MDSDNKAKNPIYCKKKKVEVEWEEFNRFVKCSESHLEYFDVYFDQLGFPYNCGDGNQFHIIKNTIIGFQMVK